jgi:hypothetical protein
MKKNNKGCEIFHNPTFSVARLSFVGILGNVKKQQES